MRSKSFRPLTYEQSVYIEMLWMETEHMDPTIHINLSGTAKFTPDPPIILTVKNIREILSYIRMGDRYNDDDRKILNMLSNSDIMRSVIEQHYIL